MSSQFRCGSRSDIFSLSIRDEESLSVMRQDRIKDDCDIRIGILDEDCHYPIPGKESQYQLGTIITVKSSRSSLKNDGFREREKNMESEAHSFN